MFQSQVNFHGYKADDLWRLNVVTSIISVQRMSWVNEVGDELALVLIGGELLYGSGFDMKTITAAGQAGAVVGWDLAHEI
jgi:kynureninase